MASAGSSQETNFSEGLAFELKSWLDPTNPPHLQVIIRTLIALRNHGGGTLLIGFKDNGDPRADDAPYDVEAQYHPDHIQEMVSRYASDPFEVRVELIDRGGRKHPRIDVPTGIRTPVRVKASLMQERDGAPVALLTKGEIPTRTLTSNGRPSTVADCSKDDLDRMMQICFDNREADIARFIRRNLAGVGPAIAELMATAGLAPSPSDAQLAAEFLDLGDRHFAEEYDRLQVPAQIAELRGWGGREVAMVISPAPAGFRANHDFLRRMLSAVPRLSSYPPWLDTAVGGLESEAKVRQGRWEALLYVTGMFDALTFEMFDPTGDFYERRLNLVDVIARRNKVTPRAVLGERQAITDVAEVFLTGLAFAGAMGVADRDHELHWAFRWTGLQGRMVDAWFAGGPSRYVSVEDTSPVCQVSFPADTPATALVPLIEETMAPMFEMFRGYSTQTQQIDEMLTALVERRSQY
ncbi:helix-turn-helix domain-containing protein [Novosphingobium sp. B-7]|uniref:AlbA family DNA-binding domain-containing protein n=1 Tax=Novosphingobium sp. B-7 TaxID=1298855 RepID=UPI0003B490E6|nr:RNA-binding domain-containing protein [Novosphingobium sp. B-7]